MAPSISKQRAQNLFQHDKISAITFSTQNASFVIPLQQVLYIEKGVKRNILLDELNRFKVFEHLVQLAAVRNSKVAQQEALLERQNTRH